MPTGAFARIAEAAVRHGPFEPGDTLVTPYGTGTARRGGAGFIGTLGGFVSNRGVVGAVTTLGRLGTAAGGYAGGVSLGALQPGAPPAAVLPGQGQYGVDTPSYCNLITNTYARAACLAASHLLGGAGGGSGQAAGSCPPGYRSDGRGGCQIEGVGGYLPGDVGRPDFVWQPVNGRYGAGVSPMAVQAQRMWCPAGYKLGKDNVCYECLKKTERKWNPGTKPMFTGGEMNAFRTVARLRKKGRKLQKLIGASTSAPRRPAPRRRRK